jgi:thymidylate synthase ThyX
MGTFDRAAKEGPLQAVNEAQKQLLIRRANIAGIPQASFRYRTDEQVVAEMRRVEAGTDFSGADRQRIQTLPEDQQKMVELLTGLLKELQGLREEAQRTNANTSRTADALTIAPGSGASFQAAQPSPQRLGR